MDWFRSWHGAPTDAKWLLIARKSGTTPGQVSAVFWALLDYASQHADRGSVADFDIETFAAWSGWDDADIAAIIDAMQQKGVITADERLSAWDKRQPKREDDSAERVRRHRERALHTPENDSVTQCNADVTQSNAPDKIRSEEIRSEKTELLSSDEDSSCEKLPTPAETKKVQTAQQEFFGAICEAIGWDYRTITKTQSGQVAQAIKALQKGGYSAADVRQFRDWWMTFDWRGLKGQAPTINQLRSDIGKIRQPVPAHQPSSNGRNGRNGTGYQTGIDWDARIGAVIPRYGAESDHEIDM